MRVEILTLCLLACFGCDRRSKTDPNSKGADSLLTYFDATKSLTAYQPSINSPLNNDDLNLFKKTADSVIKKILNNQKLSYTFTHDTFVVDKEKPVYIEYFNSDSLVKIIRIVFDLPSPYSSYEFLLSSYEYTSSKVAFKKLDQVATIALTQEFGLNKEPAYVFRINNFLYWLSAPNRLSSSFNDLKFSLNHLVEPQPIDSMTNHYKFIEKTEITNEGLAGKWYLKYITPIYNSDTSLKATFNHYDIEFTNNILNFNGSKYEIQDLSALLLPNIQTFFSYRKLYRGQDLSVHPKLRQYSGPFVQYSIWLKNNSYAIPFNSSTIDNFIKFSDSSFGFIADDKLYTLQRKN